MMNYYEELLPEEQERVTECINRLFGQTFILERKYDRRAGRFLSNPQFRSCNKHLDFLKAYFAIAGIQVCENSQMGIIYIQGEHVLGEKLPKLATIYLLILKLMYDEQMSMVSTSANVVITLSELNQRVGNYQLLKNKPSPTEMRRAISLLKKYQIIEPLTVLEELDSDSRMIIYPSIHMVLFGDDVRAMIEEFSEEEPEDEREI